MLLYVFRSTSSRERRKETKRTGPTTILEKRLSGTRAAAAALSGLGGFDADMMATSTDKSRSVDRCGDAVGLS